MKVRTVIASAPALGRRFQLGDVPSGVAAYQAASADQSGVVVSLLSELLLGARDQRWLNAPWAEGEARVHARHGELNLRKSGGRNEPRLTLAPMGSRPADAPPAGPSDWQGGLAPGVIGAVFFAAATPTDPLHALLSVRVAEAFTKLERSPGSRSAPEPVEAPPRRAADELLRRRDDLAGRIEALFATRRRESETLDHAIGELDREHAELSDQATELRRRVRALAEQLDSEGARLRYEEMTRVAAEAEGRQAADQWAPRVEELDEEVARWRATLAELESREAALRAELARVRPDDAAPQLLLADQRASVAVAQRLVVDLESEVARFARSGESPACVCDDAHPRLNPLVETLGRHVDRLADLVRQQDAAMRTQELLAEASQLERSQAELRRQLDHLLERRQTLHRSSRARSVRDERTGYVYAGSIDPTAVEREHAHLSESLRELEARLEAVARDRHDAVERRRRLLDAGQLAEWQRELDAVQAELSRVGERPAVERSATLRASDVLARLSDGAFTELRLARGGRRVEARDRSGQIVPQANLTAMEQRLVGWALRLALADACHAAGVALPLVLDQPFAELDERHATNLATCLDDYARRDRQVLVLARDGAGLSRLRALGVRVALLGEEEATPPPVAKPAPAQPAPSREVVREESIARAWLLDVDDPIDRFPVPLADRHEAFARSRVQTVGDLIAGDPSAIAEEMAIDGVTAELVALWQAHLALVCFTPGLDLAAAKTLVDCDILSVDQLAEADADHLARAMRKRGAGEATLRRLEEWIEAAGDGVARWESTGYAKRWRRNRRERRERIRDNASRRARGGRSIRLRDDKNDGGDRVRRRRRRSESSSSSRSRSSTDAKKLRFYLEVSSDIEAAPSIGPKRATQLTAIGVATVAQLLEGDPERIAADLDDSRVDAATIVAWQHQAGLMCRVPGLRGHDAQVLVGSGFASAEEVAAMKPAELLEFVDPFCDTPEGQRALRGSARPDLAEVTQWVQGARQRRAVGAA